MAVLVLARSSCDFNSSSGFTSSSFLISGAVNFTELFTFSTTFCSSCILGGVLRSTLASFFWANFESSTSVSIPTFLFMAFSIAPFTNTIARKLTESGYVIKQNVDDSYRRGVEFAASWQPVNFVKLEGNLTLSKNIIRNATFYQDLYDNEKDWNLVGQKEVTLRKSHLILSPEVVGMAKLTVLPRKDISISLSGKFVGKQYMDNATSPEAKVPAYNKFTLGPSKYFTLKSGSRITLSGVV